MVKLSNKEISFWLMLISTITYCNSANIFCIFPTASFSHQQPMLILSRALAAKGHNLTVITANPSEVPIKNHRDISVNFMYQKLHAKETEKEMGFSLQRRSSAYEIVDVFPNLFSTLMPPVHKSAQIQDLMKEVNGTKYDLLIYEPLFASSLLGFADLIGDPPIIGIASFFLFPSVDITLGNPIIPSYIGSMLDPFRDPLSFWERFKNLRLEMYFTHVVQTKVMPLLEKLMHEYFGNYNRNIWDFEYNKSLVIVSADLATGYPKPLQPNTIYVGPMHVEKNPKPLPQDVQKWMDESEDGVIYFSLGSNMKGTSVPEKTRASFIKAFKQFPKVRVLWKWETDEKLPGQPDNVLVKKWLPQQSVLAHPKTRLFISQVGLQSFQEATYYGVPILGVPMFGDQDANAMKLVNSGAGLSVEFQSITDDIIYEKLKDLLTNKSYKENMLRLSAITKDKPMSPTETAVWWVEYVLRHNGAPHLRPAVLDLMWYRYYMVDILSFFIVLLLTVLFISYFLLNKLIKSFSSLSSRNKVKTN